MPMNPRRGVVALLAMLGSAALLSQEATDPLANTALSDPSIADPPPHRALPSWRRHEAIPLETAEPSTTSSPWRSDQVMIRVTSPEVAADLAAEHSSEVLHTSRRGLVALRVPEGRSPQGFLTNLRADPRVVRGMPMGAIHGAGSNLDKPELRASEHQWHLIASRTPLAGTQDVSDFTVAVLDTGVAYEDHGDFIQVPSLAGVSFVAPWDFVNDDAHPNDDHQHGTHIASLIASEGSVEGVAPGVSIMPLKVLDADNAGTELALIDALDWAVDNGADVINMSLSFPPGYIPSIELQQALDDAHRAGVIMIAAAGNDGARQVCWPAASQVVVAVAALRPGDWDKPNQSSWDGRKSSLADYSNRGAAVDISAPGGALDYDRTEDGVLDGIMAETISSADPGTAAYWMYAGTSQATALVSGAAVQLLQAGAAPEQVVLGLQYDAFSSGREKPLDDGGGVGGMNLEKAIEAIVDQKEELDGSSTYFASVLPTFRAKDEKREKYRAQADITVIDQDGEPLDDGDVYVTVWGASESPQITHCDLHDGTCTIATDWFDDGDPDMPQVYAVEVSGVLIDKIMHRPGKALFATDGGEILLSAIADSTELDGTLLAFWFSGEDDGILEHVSEGYVILDMGTGLSSSPLGMVFHPNALSSATVTDVDVDLDGTGLSSSPLGLTTVQRVDIDGTGLSSSPLGFHSFAMVAIDGTGLSSSPLGFHPTHMTQPSTGTGLSSSPLGLIGVPLLLSTGEAIGTSVSGLAFGDILSGSARTGEGYEGASLLMATGAVPLALTTDTAGASTATAMSLEDATTW
jgi:hypothetical protein